MLDREEMQKAFVEVKTRDLRSNSGSGSKITLRYGSPRVFYRRSPCPAAVLFLASCVLCLFLYGCSRISPPDDYYQQVLEMEEEGERARQDTGREPGQVVAPVSEPESIKAVKSTSYELTPDESQQQTEQTPVLEQAEEIQEEPPQREIIQESPPPETEQVPIAVASDVVKSALNAPDLAINARTVELVNGRLTDGKNSIRVYFTPDSVDVINDRFGAICAVIYYLNSETNTVDVVVAIAEDEQSNLLAILQSSMADITAWMINEISRTEWYSRITKKML